MCQVRRKRPIIHWSELRAMLLENMVGMVGGVVVGCVGLLGLYVAQLVQYITG